MSSPLGPNHGANRGSPPKAFAFSAADTSAADARPTVAVAGTGAGGAGAGTRAAPATAATRMTAAVTAAEARARSVNSFGTSSPVQGGDAAMVGSMLRHPVSDAGFPVEGSPLSRAASAPVRPTSPHVSPALRALVPGVMHSPPPLSLRRRSSIGSSVEELKLRHRTESQEENAKVRCGAACRPFDARSWCLAAASRLWPLVPA